VGWTWAKNNKEAQIILAQGGVDEISMDHDLGCVPEDGLFAKGSAEETGLDLAHWIAEHKINLPKVTVHSWNPSGARSMANVLADAGYNVTIRPFTVQ
jgi:hypothetical protein